MNLPELALDPYTCEALTETFWLEILKFQDPIGHNITFRLGALPWAFSCTPTLFFPEKISVLRKK